MGGSFPVKKARASGEKEADAGADTAALEAEIDLQVYRLYNLTYDKVLLVEPGFAMPREEYEAALYLSN